MRCVCCDRTVEHERIAVLGNTTLCSYCAKKRNAPRVKGYMEWSHKTAPILRTTDSESFAQFKKDVDRKGQTSILRSKMSNGGRLC